MLVKKPEDAALLVKIGNIYKNAKNNEEALKYYEQALSLEPKDITANINLALIYMAQKNNEKAKFYSDVVVKEKPEYPLAYYILGVIADSEKKYQEAVSNYEKFLVLAPTDNNVPLIQKRVDVLKDYLKRLQGVKNVTKRDI